MINSLANHGYIPRDGRNVHTGELVLALKNVGLSHTLSAVFAFLVAEKSQPS
jgi:Peroxidase, family 2